MDRRDFIKKSMMTGAAFGLSSILPSGIAKAAGIDSSFMSATKRVSDGMPQRTLGSGDAAISVSAMGFGCMGLNHHRGPHPDKKQCIRLLQQAADEGVTLFDTAESYGPWVNEELVGEALHSRRHDVCITTKFGNTFINGKHNIGVEDCRPENIRKVCEASLRRLNMEAIPLFYQHRQDKNVPVEEVAGTVSDLIKEGKVLHFGLSEVNADTIRRAHKVCPVTAVESEFHLMWQTPAEAVFPTLEELGIGFVAYSPITRGFLGGKLNPQIKFDEDNDNRAWHGQFTPDALRDNTPILNELFEFGRTRGMTSAQVALAWMLTKYPFLVPIPGTTKRAHLLENNSALDFTLSADDMAQLETAVARHKVYGERANLRDTSIQR